MKIRSLQFVVLAGLSLVLLNACGYGERLRVGDQRHDYEVIELGALDAPQVRIEMGAGKLFVAGGAEQLMEADFIYNVAALEPEIRIDDRRLSILTPETRVSFGSLFDLDDYRNDWDLRFNDDVPMDLDIGLGLGQASLNLGSLNVERLDIDGGAGDLDLSLVGSSLQRFTFDAGLGNVRVDLSGAWSQDLDVRIESGVGEITLILPRSADLSVEVDGGIVDLNAEEFALSNGVYTSEAPPGAATIDIRIDAGVGEINLLLAD